VVLVAAWFFTSRSEALRAEAKMKHLSHQKKAEYVNSKVRDFEGGVRVAIDF
jgi:predicted GIY-YIG superfamily endonuclease